MQSKAMTRWHEVVRMRDTGLLTDLLADDVVFESPVVHTPQVGREVTQRYLVAAMEVLNNDSFKYLNEWYQARSGVLEFQTTCEGILINGIDMISWNEEQRITGFKVMVRPLKAVNKLHEMMLKQLTQPLRS